MSKPRKQKSKQTSAPKKINPFTVIKLWTQAGGRCEFNGCNEYLLTDKLTLSDANFSNIGHIVARTIDGPRGNDHLPIAKRNEIENLMLLCTKCHHLIDDKKLIKQHSKELLMEYKKEHEDRILQLTSIQPGNKTELILFKANIGGEAVVIPIDHIHAAIYPRYATNTKGIVIDLTTLPKPDDSSFYATGTKMIEQAITGMYQAGIETKTISHLSVFALGPIPLLIYLGSRLSNKIETELYQRHRDTQRWEWKKTDSSIVNYTCRTLQSGNDPKKVALLLSLSGQLTLNDLPPTIGTEFTVYEITLENIEPHREFLNTRQALNAFRKAYEKFMADLRAKHGTIEEIHLFPAVPTPIAVVCGKDLLLKIDPTLIVYDNVKGNFELALTVNKTA